MAYDPPDYVLVFEDEWNHDGDGVQVGRIGGDRPWWSIETLHEQLARQEKELAAKGREMKLLRPAWSAWPDPPPGGRPWYERRGGRAIAFGGFAALAVSLALTVGMVRRKRDGP